MTRYRTRGRPKVLRNVTDLALGNATTDFLLPSGGLGRYDSFLRGNWDFAEILRYEETKRILLIEKFSISIFEIQFQSG